MGQARRSVWGARSLVAILAVGAIQLAEVWAEPIQPGETRTGVISSESEVDTYTFSADAGDAVTILMVSTSALRTIVELRSPEDAVLATAGGNAFSAYIQAYKVATTGTYSIACRSYSFTGSYDLSLVKNPGPNVVDPDGGTILPGQTRTGSIAVEGDIDVFEFEVSAGDTVTILMTSPTGSSVRTILELHGPDGTVVTTAGGNAFSAYIQALKLNEGGTYLLLCRSYSFAGSYNLSLVKNPGPNAPDPDGGTIVIGETKTGTIDVEGDMDVFDFQASAGEGVTIVMQSTLGSALRPILELHAPDGTVVASAGGNVFTAPIDSLVLGQSGTYLIICRGYAFSGGYQLSTSRIGPPTSFYTVTPCRVFDTREASGPTLGAPLSCGTEQSFEVAGKCGVPFGAEAISLNLTGTRSTAPGNLRLFASGTSAPLASTLNYVAGQTRANNAVIPLGIDGEISVLCSPSGTTHVVLDVNGYFQ
jgi:hypothetical protein